MTDHSMSDDGGWMMPNGWPVRVDPETGMTRAVPPADASPDECFGAVWELSREWWRRRGVDPDAPMRRDVVRIIRPGDPDRLRRSTDFD